MRQASRALGTLAAAACLVLAGAVLALADWPTYHGEPQLQGRAAQLHPGAPRRVWRYRAGSPLAGPPVADAERVYAVTERGAVHAIGMDGARRWVTRLGSGADAAGEPVRAAAAVSDGIVAVATRAGNLYGLDAAGGQIRWRCPVGAEVLGAPNLVHDHLGHGVVAVSQSDGVVHRVQRDSGTRVWATAPSSRSDGPASVGSGRVVLGNCDSALFAYAADDGRLLQRIPLGRDGQVFSGVALDGAQAYAGDRSGQLLRADLATGRVVWSSRVTRGEISTTPALGAERVLFSAADGRVRALSRATGRLLWERALGDRPGAPVLAGELVLVPADGTLFALELAGGTLRWKHPIADQITSAALSAGLILVGADDGTVTALSTAANREEAR